MPTDPQVPRHRYHLEELLGETPDGWEITSEGCRYNRARGPFPQKWGVWIVSQYEDSWILWGYPAAPTTTPTGKIVDIFFNRSWTNPYHAMAEIDEWIEEHPNG